jgi:hypothetical protein
MKYHFELEPIYGAIPRDGEYVRVGDVLGLSVDGSTIVSAPFEGHIRIDRSSGNAPSRLFVHILPIGPKEKEAGA